MSSYKLLFLDIDGTILQPDHTYQTSTKEAILQAQEQGIEVFLATGRPVHEIRELGKELNVHSYIGYNGALALHEEKVIVNEPMEKETVLSFCEIARKNNHELLLYTNERNYFTSLDQPEVRQVIDTFQLQENELFSEDVAHRILGGTLISLTEEDTLLYEISSNYRLSQVNVESLLHCYDIVRKTVNKGSAIKRITEQLGVRREEVIAFGDGMNDVEMLQFAGESFAMANANPDLFQYAKHKTTSVMDSGIFRGLQSLGIVK